jgi:PAP2 superfamily
MTLLVALLWPLGMSLIVVAGWWLARGRNGSFAPRDNWVTRRSPTPRAVPAGGGTLLLAGWVLVGAIVTVGIVLVLGAVAVVHHGHVVDTPIYRFTIEHQTHRWAHVMKRATKIGNTWTTWGAALAAAACLAVGWRRNKWLPIAALALVIVVDHFATLGLRHVFERPGPPNSPHGTYPSGGCERVVLFYGLITYLLWREFSGTRRFAIWGGAVVAALAYNEAYSRLYLTLHWFTDAVSGVLYGVLFLAAFIVAIRLVIGPADPIVRGGDDHFLAQAGAIVDPHKAVV